jgi:hypothetical protein
VVLAFAKRVVSAMETGDMASEPFITFHLLPLAHVVNVSLPGEVRGQIREPCTGDPLAGRSPGMPV